jgi:hypothetical protein
MPTGVLAPGQANVSDYTDKPSSWHQRRVAMHPDLIQLGKRMLVVLDVTHLSSGVSVFLQGPIWWGGQH